jgi:hypothetical protein
MKFTDDIKVTQDRRLPVLSAIRTDTATPDPATYSMVYRSRLVIEREHVVSEYALAQGGQREVEHKIRTKMRRSINRQLYAELIPLIDDLINQIEFGETSGALTVVSDILKMMDLDG